MNQQPLEDVFVPPQVCSTHPAGLVEMGEAAFDQLPTRAQQPPITLAADAAAIGIDRELGIDIAGPLPARTLGLRDVGAQPMPFQGGQRRSLW